METKRELQIKAKELIESSPRDSIAIGRKIWTDFDGVDKFNLYDAIQVLKAAKKDSSVDFDFVYNVAKVFSDNNDVINNFKWFVFYKYLKSKSSTDFLQNEVNINKFLSLTTQNNLRVDNTYPCPYTIATIGLAKGHSKNLFNGRKVNEYLDKLNSLFLSQKNRNYIKDGEEVKVASDLESYYALKTKALFKTEQYEDCKILCELALNDLSEFHYNNDLWFKMRIALSYEKLGEFEKSEELFQKLVSTKAGNDKWFLYYDIADLYYQQDNLDKALKYSINATFFGIDFDKMNGLLLLQARILFKLNRKEDGKIIAQLIASVLKKFELKVKQDYERMFTYFGIDSQNCQDFNLAYKVAHDFWVLERYRGLYEISGKITFVHPNGKFGKIETIDNKTFNFHKRHFNKKQRNIIELKGSKVTFVEMKSFDGKTVAENIKVFEKAESRSEALLLGTELAGTIKNFADFGIFVKLHGHKDGLIHKSALPSSIKNTFKDVYQNGQKIKVRVEKISERGIELKIINE